MFAILWSVVFQTVVIPSFSDAPAGMTEQSMLDAGSRENRPNTSLTDGQSDEVVCLPTADSKVKSLFPDARGQVLENVKVHHAPEESQESRKGSASELSEAERSVLKVPVQQWEVERPVPKSPVQILRPEQLQESCKGPASEQSGPEVLKCPGQFFMSEGLHESRKGPASEQSESETSVLESVLQILKLLLPLCVLPLCVIWKVRGSSQSGTCKTDAGEWVATHLAASAQVENEAWADVQWVEERLEPFRRVSKVERRDSRFLSVVRLKKWQKFSESLLDAVCNDGAEEPRSLLKAKLAAVPKLGVLDDFEHVVFMNYESGGSRYRSCVKILCKRLNEDEVAVAYGMYGQEWVDRKHYLTDQTFWEQSPNQQKMENFLKAGVSGVVKELLSGDLSALAELLSHMSE